jgi:hypothetical protein
VAVAVVAFGGVWINQNAGGEDSTNAADSGVSTMNESGEDAAAPAAGVGRVVPSMASGTDYTDQSVAAGSSVSRSLASGKATQGDAPGSQSGDPDITKSAQLPPALSRLTDPAALSSCVNSITREHGQGPISVQVADFASYRGDPALVVFFTDPAGARWGWVVGPDCGPAGADGLFTTRVG